MPAGTPVQMAQVGNDASPPGPDYRRSRPLPSPAWALLRMLTDGSERPVVAFIRIDDLAERPDIRGAVGRGAALGCGRLLNGW
jgi:hypothetical protein